MHADIDFDNSIHRQRVAVRELFQPYLRELLCSGLDDHIREELGAKYMVRYMDDVVIFGPNKKKLQNRKAINAYLVKLKLSMKGNWQIWDRFAAILIFSATVSTAITRRCAGGTLCGIRRRVKEGPQETRIYI